MYVIFPGMVFFYLVSVKLNPVLGPGLWLNVADY